MIIALLHQSLRRSNWKAPAISLTDRSVRSRCRAGLTLEISRTCTDGTRNANSMLYGALWRAAKALGYSRCITYTQHGESGASLRGAGWLPVAELRARGSWADSTGDPALKAKRDPNGPGGVARIRWEVTR